MNFDLPLWGYLRLFYRYFAKIFNGGNPRDRVERHRDFCVFLQIISCQPIHKEYSMDHKKLDTMVNQFMDDSVPYKHHIAPHIEDMLKEVVDLVAGVADELSDEELGYLVRNTLVKIVDEQYMS